MGASQSVPKGGYKVIKVCRNSPSFKSGLEPYFDYIISVNNRTVDRNHPELIQSLGSNFLNKQVTLGVWNSRLESLRKVLMTPTNNWHMNSTDINSPGSIGCVIKYSSCENAQNSVFRVLKIYENSPSERSGLVENRDYIIDSPEIVMDNEQIFAQSLEEYDGRRVTFIVYNLDWEECREIHIIPDKNWGGAGLLGCDIGFGYIHSIPKTTFKSIEYKSKFIYDAEPISINDLCLSPDDEKRGEGNEVENPHNEQYIISDTQNQDGAESSCKEEVKDSSVCEEVYSISVLSKSLIEFSNDLESHSSASKTSSDSLNNKEVSKRSIYSIDNVSSESVVEPIQSITYELKTSLKSSENDSFIQSDAKNSSSLDAARTTDMEDNCTKLVDGRYEKDEKEEAPSNVVESQDTKTLIPYFDQDQSKNLFYDSLKNK